MNRLPRLNALTRRFHPVVHCGDDWLTARLGWPISMRSFVLIVNPHAGRGRAAQLAATAQVELRFAGALARIQLTTSIQHATELASVATSDGEISVAVGGDGILRAVVNGAARQGGTIGIVPCGRGNDFARMVGIVGTRGCVDVLLNAAPQATDCIAVAPGVATAGHPGYDLAIGNVYLGFDSLSNMLANKLKVRLGTFSYSYTAVRAALTMHPYRFRLVVDDQRIEYSGSGVVIANSGYYGRGIHVAPRADVQDGLLDVVMFEQVTRSARIATLSALRSGKHERRLDVRHLRASRIEVRMEPALEAYSDGDPITAVPLTAWVLPGAISVLRPTNLIGRDRRPDRAGH